MLRDNTSTTGAGTGIGIYLLNDTTIATGYTDLWDGTIANLFNVDEQGDSAPYANSRCGREPMVTDQQAA